MEGGMSGGTFISYGLNQEGHQYYLLQGWLGVWGQIFHPYFSTLLRTSQGTICTHGVGLDERVLRQMVTLCELGSSGSGAPKGQKQQIST